MARIVDSHLSDIKDWIESDDFENKGLCFAVPFLGRLVPHKKKDNAALKLKFTKFKDPTKDPTSLADYARYEKERDVVKYTKRYEEYQDRVKKKYSKHVQKTIDNVKKERDRERGSSAEPTV